MNAFQKREVVLLKMRLLGGIENFCRKKNLDTNSIKEILRTCGRNEIRKLFSACASFKNEG